MYALDHKLTTNFKLNYFLRTDQLIFDWDYQFQNSLICKKMFFFVISHVRRRINIYDMQCIVMYSYIDIYFLRFFLLECKVNYSLEFVNISITKTQFYCTSVKNLKLFAITLSCLVPIQTLSVILWIVFAFLLGLWPRSKRELPQL